jgi:hypothetical protein
MTLLALPHKVCDGTCYINGLEDILAWKGRTYPDFLLSLVGGMAGFAFLKIKVARPPCQVYWGANPKYLLQNLEPILGFTQEISEGKGGRTALAGIRAAIDRGEPVMAGALDMFYLHYYPKLYHKRHIPIHYLLVVGYDDSEQAFLVHDCGRPGVERVPYDDLGRALDVKVPGMSLKNTYRVFRLAGEGPPELDVARQGFAQKAQQMLQPPISFLGIPAMRKLAKDIAGWTDRSCFEHLATFATVPPQLPKRFDHSDGLRQVQARLLRSLGEQNGVAPWVRAADLFEQSGGLIVKLCKAALKEDGPACAPLVGGIADLEEEAYGLLKAAF